VPCGMLSSFALGFLGLFLDELLICMLLGGMLVAIGVLLCGRWYPLVFYGVFGGQKNYSNYTKNEGITFQTSMLLVNSSMLLSIAHKGIILTL
jgi:hypothetical protein